MTTTHPQPVEIPTDPHAVFGALATLATFDEYPCLDDDDDTAPTLHTLTAGTVWRVEVHPFAGGERATVTRIISSGRPR